MSGRLSSPKVCRKLYSLCVILLCRGQTRPRLVVAGRTVGDHTELDITAEIGQMLKPGGGIARPVKTQMVSL